MKILYFVLITTLAGCAVNRDIRVESTPSGAEVTEFSVPPMVAVTLMPVSEESSSDIKSSASAERLSELNALVERGLISEEEYQEARRSILGI